MITFAYICFWLCLTGVLWTYLFYPAGMLLFSSTSKPLPEKNDQNLPEVDILFAAYNEAAVIEKKIRSCFESNYPAEKISLYIGSDCSNDGTDEIIRQLQSEYPRLRLHRFEKRTGKTGIINFLTKHSRAPYLLLTDANVMFARETVPALVQRLLIEKATIVGGNMVYPGKELNKGISLQENAYLNLENRIKAAEANRWQMVMGVEGGCYLIKREAFPPIPPTFFMEDFFVSMHVLSEGGKVLFEPKAVVYEDVSTIIKEEYKRKVRISIGNFQNLHYFKALLWQRFRPLGFAFLSHKVLRWLTPFFLLGIAGTGIYLAFIDKTILLFMLFYAAFVLLALMGVVFSRGKGLAFLKFPGHFLYMNLALLHGFIKYLNGIDSNVWQPTKRNQA